MSKSQELRERFTDTSTAYSLIGTYQKQLKEITVELLCATSEQNEKLDKIIELLSKNDDVLAKKEVTPRQKVTS